jgi:hypothetical protein
MAKSKKAKKSEEFRELYLKANRRGSREAELEGLTGFTSKHKVHKSKKTYSRKGKSKEVFV